MLEWDIIGEGGTCHETLDMLVLFILVFAAAVLPAQMDLAVFEGAFQDFADAAVGSLASTATSGLAWSPAHIGQFPHFGVGLTVGAAMMPYEAVKPVFENALHHPAFRTGFPADLRRAAARRLRSTPASADSGFPFDIGFKIGFIPEQVQALLGDVQADYFIAGGDFRFAILQDKGFVPALSVGVGYSYLKGGVEVAGLMAGPQDRRQRDHEQGPDGTNFLNFSNPTLAFTWQSHVIEAKIQVSKNLLIFTPHLGVRRCLRPGIVRWAAGSFPP